MQLDWIKNIVDDPSIRDEGTQETRTVDNHHITLSIISLLPHLHIQPYTDTEWEMIPHSIHKIDENWNPTFYYVTDEDDSTWYKSLPDSHPDNVLHTFNEYGKYIHCYIFQLHVISENAMENFCIPMSYILTYNYTHNVKPENLDYETMGPLLLTRKIYICSYHQIRETSYERILRNHCKSPFPALNVQSNHG